MKDNLYKNTIVLIPSAWSEKALGDVINFAKYYKDNFNVVVLSNKHEELIIEEDGIFYVKAKTSLSDYYVYTSEFIIDAGTINRHSRIWGEQFRISVWHGIPYKKMFTQIDEKYLYSALNYGETYDLMVSPSEFYTQKFLKQSMLYTSKSIEIGSSRCDLLFLSDEEKLNVRSKLNLEGKKLVLYAPTFRKAGIVELEFNAKKIIENLGSDYILGIKLHYLNELADENNDYFINLTSYESVNELLSITEILITDYSSLMFDYSVIGKNIILYQYDIEEYEEERGLMFDVSKYIDQKYIVHNESDLYKSLINIEEQNLSEFKENFYPFEDGKSTKRIVDYINIQPINRTLSEVVFLVNDLHQIGGIHNFINETAKIFKQKYNCKIIVIGINEFNRQNDKLHVFNSKYVDIKISSQNKAGACKQILLNTTGQIISTQFSAHKKFQSFIQDKNVSLMFHGDVKDIISKKLYSWHLEQLNNHNIYNYKSLLFLTKSNSELIKPHLTADVKNCTSYIENTFNFNNLNLYSKSGIFVAVTRFDEDKNIFDLIKVFSHPKINSKFKLHVYGDGPLINEFKHEITVNNLENNVILKGYCNDKSEIYQNKQGLVSVSLTEGLPLTMLEAINYSIPIYAYNSFTAIRDIVTKDNGMIVDINDFNMFCECLNQEKTYDNIFKTSEKFSNEVILNKWVDIFTSNENIESIKIGKIQNNINLKLMCKNKLFKKYRKLNMRNKVLIRSIYIKLKLKKIKLSKTPLISVIVPFYNNNDVIENCIKSLYNQEYKNIEILLINDGSEFKRQDLLSKYPKIKYIEKENQGPGMTRNLGIDSASGEYLFFLDSDDTIAYGALSLLMNSMLKNNLFIVSGKTIRIDFNNINNRHVWFYSIYKDEYVNLKHERHRLLSDTLSTNKLYNREKLIESKIRFQPGLYEDKLFVNKIYKYYDEIGIINDFVYNWYVYGEKTSITTSLSIFNFEERLNRMNEIWEFSSDIIKSSNYHFAINHDFKIYLNNFNSYNEDEQKILFDHMSNFLIKNKEYYHKDYIANIFNLTYVNAIFNNDYNKFRVISIMNSNVEKRNREQND